MRKKTPKASHKKNVKDVERRLRRAERLKNSIGAKLSSARIVFTIVPYGWQCDVEIAAKGMQPARGSVCRDFGDDHRSAKRLLDKLIDMGTSGAP